MNWAQFKDHIRHMCLAGAVVASQALTQEVADLSTFSVMTNTFVTKSAEISETFRKNSIRQNMILVNSFEAYIRS